MNEPLHDVDQLPAPTAADDVPPAAVGNVASVSAPDLSSADPRVPVAVVSAAVIVAGFIARAGVRTISGARTRRVLRTARHRLGL